jgi:MFS family permease
MVIGFIGIVWFVLRQLKGAKRFKAFSDRVYAARKAGADEATVQKLKDADVQPPLLDLTVLRNRSFAIGTITATLSFFAFSSILVIMPLYIQNDRGYSATMSGLIMLPGALGQCISQFAGGRALDRFGARPVALTGAILLFAGTLMMSTIGPHTWIWWVSICQFIRQIGMGFVLMPITTWSLNCLKPREVSAGSAVTNTARQLGGAIGAPVLVILMETFTKMRQNALGGGAEHAAAASIFGVQTALRISSAIVLVMVFIVLFGVKGDGAGSTRDLTHRAMRRLHAEVEERAGAVSGSGAWPARIE